MEEKMNIQKNECSTAFKWFHATSLNGGPQLIAATINSYFAIFLTDQFKIPAAVASMILLIASVWDAINDPIMGAIGQEPASALFGINLVRFGIPALIAFALALLLRFYPLEKYYPEIMEMKKNMKANEE